MKSRNLKTALLLASTIGLAGCKSEWTGFATGQSINLDMHAIMSGNYQRSHDATVGPFKTLQECKAAIGRAEVRLKSVMSGYKHAYMTGYECCENAEWVTHLRIECTDIVHVPLPKAETQEPATAEPATTEPASDAVSEPSSS